MRRAPDLGYDYASNAGVPNHSILLAGRDSTEGTHLIVAASPGEPWRNNLAVRDALRSDKVLRNKFMLSRNGGLGSSIAGWACSGATSSRKAFPREGGADLRCKAPKVRLPICAFSFAAYLGPDVIAIIGRSGMRWE